MTARQFRRGDTVRWNEALLSPYSGDNDLMYVTHVAEAGITTDSWSAINPEDLLLVKPVEDKYDELLDTIGGALKARDNA